jgi:hypothetical protein
MKVMNTTINETVWFQVYNNLETLNKVSKKRMEIKKDLVTSNSFYKNDEKYDILIDDLIQEVMSKNPNITTKCDINENTRTSKEYWNFLYNLKN